MNQVQSRKDLKSVYATVADGVVWYAVDRARPRSYGKGPHDFLSGSYCRGADEVRVVALPQNAPLIRDAFALSMRGGWSVHLAGPDVVPPSASAADPASVVISARATADPLVPVPGEPGWARPASLGGWHRMQSVEWVPYILAASLVEGDPLVDCTGEFDAHPILRRLAFVDPLDREAALRVVAEIRDPRWFCDPSKPDPSRSRLAAYFGLGGPRGRNAERRAVLESAWGLGEAVASDVEPDDPRAFVLSYYRSRAGDLDDPSRGAVALREAASVRASRYFLDFVRLTWLDVLYPRVGDGLFAPDHFFGRLHKEAGDVLGSAGAYASYDAAGGSRDST